MKVKNKKIESGYILAFTLFIITITVSIAIATLRTITKETQFGRYVENSKVAYSAAAAGMECAQYLDSMFVNYATDTPPSIFLNSTSTAFSGGKANFEDNLEKKVFSTANLNNVRERSGVYGTAANDLIDKIYCASDGAYNKIFLNTNYAATSGIVFSNINNKSSSISSYNLVGTSNIATTTFGLIIKDEADKFDSCAFVKFAKNSTNGITTSWYISSTGYSSCDGADKNRVSRSIIRTSDQ